MTDPISVAAQARELADGPGSALLLWGLQHEDQTREILRWYADAIFTLDKARNVLECEGPEHRGCRLTIENESRRLIAAVRPFTAAGVAADTEETADE